jgi:hypothetical protein
MKTYTIDTDNNITVFGSKKEAATASATPFDPFTSQSELAELAADWPTNRLVEIWNSIAGVNPVTKFTNRKVAVERIWKVIQPLGAVAAQPAEEAAEPVVEAPSKEPALAEPVPNVDALVPEVAPEAAGSAPKSARAKKVQKKATPPKADGVREGSKSAQVVALLQRKDGATLAEIMQKMGWQKHTVRGFMTGTMKKAGYNVESFKPEGGERTYRINN